MYLGPSAIQTWSIIDVLAPFAGNLMLHSTVLILAGFAFSWLLRHESAALQSLIVRTFLAAVLLSPLITVIVQSAGVHGIMLDIPRVAPADTAQSAQAISIDNERMAAAAIGERKTEKSPSVRIAEPVVGHDRTFTISLFPGLHSRRTFFTAFIVLWLILSLVNLIRLLTSYARIKYLEYRAFDAPWEDIRTCREVAHELEVDAPVVLKSPMVSGPFLTGILKPALILPPDVTVSREVIYHEIAHLARRDCLWNILAMLGIVLIPFQPLMYIMARRIEQLSDYVCDDYVLECRGNRKIYAHQLLDLAERRHRMARYSAVIAGAVTSKSELRRRIERLLKQQRVRIVNGCRTVLVVTGAAVILGFTIGSVYFNNRPHRVLSAFFSVMSFELVMHPEPPDFITAIHHEQAPAVAEFPQEFIAGNNTEPAESAFRYSRILDSDLDGKMAMASLAYQLPAHSLNSEKVLIGEERKFSEIPDDRIESIRQLIEEQAQPLTIEMALERLGLTEKDVATYEACKTLGEKLLETRRYSLAEKIFEKALVDYDMSNPEITNLMGMVYLGKGDMDLARIYFKKAIILDPSCSIYQYNLGNVYWAMGKRVDAMSQFGKATEMNPSYATVKGRLY